MAFNVKVVLHKAREGGWWVEVPALPGCVSQGETRKETLDNIKEAIALHLDSLGHYRQVPASKESQIATVCVSA